MGLAEVAAIGDEGDDDDEAADGRANVGVKADIGVETDVDTKIAIDDEVEVDVTPDGGEFMTALTATLDATTVAVEASGKTRVASTCSSETSASPN